jgi:hypothetical protein
LHLEALRELGPEYSDAVAKSLLEQLEPLIEAKIEQRFARGAGLSKLDQRRVLALGVTLGLAIPLTAVAGGIAGVVGVAIAWAAILFILWRLSVI